MKSIDTAPPEQLGYMMPAEWERHEATWLGWPHHPTDWPGKMEAIQWAYAEIVRRLATAEKVRIAVQDAAMRNRATRYLRSARANLSRVEFFKIPTNRGWMRDSGPIFVVRRRKPAARAIVHFHFNAWAKYYDWRSDRRVPERVAEALRVPLVDARFGRRRVVLEGGAIDVNGRGTLITTEECLLDQRTQSRNPGMTRSDLESVLRAYLGARNVIWLWRGIAGDDTHGHVDDLCRFVNARTLVLCGEKNRGDPNRKVLDENFERLRDARLEDGSRPEVVRLPMPSPVCFKGVRLPASYANFYISNAAVLVPTFNDPADRVALGIIGELVRDRPVVGIHAVDLVLGLGTLHCLTQQQPAVQ